MVKFKVYFETFGCTSNRADTQIMEGFVEDNHEIVDSAHECDVAVINSCGVIEHTQRKVIRRVKEIKSDGKRVILAGCLPKIYPDSLLECKPDYTLPPDSISLMPDTLKTLEEGLSFQTLVATRPDKAAMKRRENGSVIAAIPIAEGCLGKCSYCATRFARGRLKSFDRESIKRGVKKAVSSGCREIQLTAQDTGVYGRERGKNLAELVNEVCSIEGDFRIRVGMMNPCFTMNILEDLIEVFKSKKVYRFLHLPVQSGDDDVLKDMCRGYTVEEFKKIVRSFRKELPEITLSTDVIIGYPSEDEASFSKTYRLIEQIRPDILNITRFSPRPNTPAALLKDLPDRIKKERSRKMTSLAKKISSKINKRHLGKEEAVLITEKGKKGTLLARTDSYKQVVLVEGRLGEFRKVKIKESATHYLIAC
jgi:MiaB-like tRNA modifying enzyme